MNAEQEERGGTSFCLYPFPKFYHLNPETFRPVNPPQGPQHSQILGPASPATANLFAPYQAVLKLTLSIALGALFSIGLL